MARSPRHEVSAPSPAASAATGLSLVVARYGAALLRFVRRRTGNDEEAEDIVQDVFLRLTQIRDLSSVENPERYLFRAATNALHDRHRRHYSRMAALGEFAREQKVEFSPERLLIGCEAVKALEQAIQALPDRTRTIFVLRSVEGLRAVQVASLLGISRRSVEKHHSAAMKRIAADLSDHLG